MVAGQLILAAASLAGQSAAALPGVLLVAVVLLAVSLSVAGAARVLALEAGVGELRYARGKMKIRIIKLKGNNQSM